MPKLPTFKGIYIPKDVEFMNEEGKIIPNSEFPFKEQVKTKLTYATLSQKDEYMQSYGEARNKKGMSPKIKTDIYYDVALKKHVIKIENLFDENNKEIKNGIELVKCQHPGLNDFKQDLFYRICGIRLDDEEENDGPGELTEGEEKASV